MPELLANDTQIHFEVVGEGEPVAFLNGVMMTTQSWVLQTAFLRHRFRCVLHDLRGQLLSGKPETPWTMDTHAEDLLALLDHLAIDRCHLVGTSYGGEVGLIFAARYPQRVQSLALIASVSHVGPRLARAVETWRDAALEAPERLYRVALPFNYSESFLAANADLVRQGEERLAACPPEFFPAFARLVDAFTQLDARGRLPAISCPTLVMVGEEDALKPVAYSRELAEGIRDAEFLVVPGAGHAVVIERPMEVNTAVLGFLEKHRLEIGRDEGREVLRS